MFERFTESARQAVVTANEQSRRLEHDHVGTEHLLLGLLCGKENPAIEVLAESGVDYERCLSRLREIMRAGQGGELDADALRSVGIDLDAVRRKVEETFGPGALDSPPVTRGGKNRQLAVLGRAPFTPRTKKVLQLALREAVWLKHNEIGAEHVLLGLLRDGSGLAARILADLGVDLTDLRTSLLSRMERIA